ncbi:MAG: TauD/TfdA family dioxygenase [Alphaproteobacteria bacterium]|nr:TauD/TfdA family dioxygenase [Alphaproteobacteria bacterium]
MAITITALSQVLGARVEGLDLRRTLAAGDFAAVRQALLDHQVLCFPGQRISANDQIAFCELFGAADSDYKLPPQHSESEYRKGVMLVSNVRKDGQPIGNLPDGDMQFHSDGAHRDRPYLATTLYAIRVPSHGGDTLFANLYAAYDALDDDTKARISGLRIHNAYVLDATKRDEERRSGGVLREAEHPLVRVHPDTGRKALYLNRLMSRRIVGLPRDQGDDLLERLLDHVERPEFIYAHRWTPGDFLIWDNRCVNHARTDFPADEVRLLRRYTISEKDTAVA